MAIKANIVIEQGTDFSETFDALDSDGNLIDLTNYSSASASIPSSDGVSINYDANVKNEGAVLGTDYDFDFPDNDVVRITSNATQNLKVRIV